MNEHTPGPWEITIRGYDYLGINQAGRLGTSIFWVNKQHGVKPYRSESDARLIAAAPDLLDACKDAEIIMDTMAILGIASRLPPGYKASWPIIHEKLQRAIAKAEGREEES